MALNKEKLKEDLKEALSNPDVQDNTEKVIEKIATAIEAYVKSGEVIVAKGIALQAGTYAGATTTEGRGKIT